MAETAAPTKVTFLNQLADGSSGISAIENTECTGERWSMETNGYQPLTCGTKKVGLQQRLGVMRDFENAPVGERVLRGLPDSWQSVCARWKTENVLARTMDLARNYQNTQKEYAYAGAGSREKEPDRRSDEATTAKASSAVSRYTAASTTMQAPGLSVQKTACRASNALSKELTR